jgi:hypothetical protein
VTVNVVAIGWNAVTFLSGALLGTLPVTVFLVFVYPAGRSVNGRAATVVGLGSVSAVLLAGVIALLIGS